MMSERRGNARCLPPSRPIRQQRRVGRLTLVHAKFFLEYEVARHGNGVSIR
jgi:hypothetical protein